jgi:hypothetical protein
MEPFHALSHQRLEQAILKAKTFFASTYPASIADEVKRLNNVVHLYKFSPLKKAIVDLLVEFYKKAPLEKMRFVFAGWVKFFALNNISDEELLARLAREYLNLLPDLKPIQVIDSIWSFSVLKYKNTPVFLESTKKVVSQLDLFKQDVHELTYSLGKISLLS